MFNTGHSIILVTVMRVIFLDFDGVLNTDRGRNNRLSRGLPTRDKYEELFDEEAVENFRMIMAAAPDALIVIESTWKSSLGGISELREMWKIREMPGRIYSVTEDAINFPDLLNLDLSDMDVFAKVAGMGKGYGIKKWVERHYSPDFQYVIIDDVPDFLPEQKSHLVCPNARVGLTAEDAIRAIEILKS